MSSAVTHKVGVSEVWGAEEVTVSEEDVLARLSLDVCYRLHNGVL